MRAAIGSALGPWLPGSNTDCTSLRMWWLSMALNHALRSTGRRRWVTYGGLVVVLALVWPAWRQIDSASRERAGMAAMADGDYSKAAEILESASAAYPRDKDLAYLSAVAHRRNGN